MSQHHYSHSRYNTLILLLLKLSQGQEKHHTGSWLFHLAQKPSDLMQICKYSEKYMAHWDKTYQSLLQLHELRWRNKIICSFVNKNCLLLVPIRIVVSERTSINPRLVWKVDLLLSQVSIYCFLFLGGGGGRNKGNNYKRIFKHLKLVLSEFLYIFIICMVGNRGVNFN